MIYVVGDTHGKQARWVQIEPILSAGDTIIIAGDFGVGFWDNEEAFFDHISRQFFTVLFIDGNHENFSSKLNSYPVELWNGGRVQKIRHNLIHLMRGEVYMIEEKTFFTFGGGYSRDRYRRHDSWDPEELPSEEEYANAEANLRRVNYQIDYIITHTAPSETVKRLGVECAARELRLNRFLDYVRDQVIYQRWVFGHFHTAKELWRNQTAIYNALRELESGAIVKVLK